MTLRFPFPFLRPLAEARLNAPFFPESTNLSEEIPASLEKPLAQAKDKERVSVDADRKEVLHQEEREIAQQIPWLWFEFTPFEVGCDELGGKITLRLECDKCRVI